MVKKDLIEMTSVNVNQPEVKKVKLKTQLEVKIPQREPPNLNYVTLHRIVNDTLWHIELIGLGPGKTKTFGFC